MADQIPHRTIAEAMQERTSGQMEALETLIARVMDEVAASAGDKTEAELATELADRLRPHLPVDSVANAKWLTERARMIRAAR